MKKLICGLIVTFGIGIFAGCATMPVTGVREMPDIGENSVPAVTESAEFDVTGALELTATPEPMATSEPTATMKPTATPRPTVAPIVDRNVVERDAYAVNGKNGKIHKTGDCPATGTGKNAMTNPVYFGTYEEAEAHSERIKPSLDKRKCGNCWR